MAYLSRVKIWIAGEVLYASDLNSEFDNLINNVITDPAGATHGDVLYRGATSWLRLGAGNNLDTLRSGGAGAAPYWAAPVGYSGYSGGSGYSGYSGYSGTSGFSAASPGASGYSGYSSTSGFSGFSGTNGTDGGSGYSGYSGTSGYSGVGTSGYSGYSGPQGVIGDDGISGYSGYSGYSADSGYSGESGYSAASGYSGRSGFSGYSGKSGYSGTNGTNGTNGTSGYSGPSGYSGYSGLTTDYNLALNGSFENWTEHGTGGPPDHWESYGTATAARDTGEDDGFGGSYAVKITTSAVSSGIRLTLNGLPVGVQIVCKARWKVTAGDEAWIYVESGGSSTELTGGGTSWGDSSTGSTSIDSSGQLIITIGSKNNGDIVWFDRLRVNYGSTARDYFPAWDYLFTGTSGYSGYSGGSGFSGPSGYSGYSSAVAGTSGYSGYSGVGTSGYSGAQGTNGTSGYSGYSSAVAGTSGFSGYSGTGTSGYSGYSGQDGASGYSGYSSAVAGTSGFSGYSGAPDTGESGYSGYSGYSSAVAGTSGYSGFSGVGTSGYSGWGGGNYVHTQSSSSDTWNITHNLGYKEVIVQVYDSSDAQLIPLTVTWTDTNHCVVTLEAAATGKAVISSGGGQSGYSGYSGEGTSGFSGSNGSNGTSGFSGYSGTSGYSGSNGSNGTSGFSGYSGTSGYSGSNGSNGTSGYSGYSGSNGSNGTSGYSGYSGTKPAGQLFLSAAGGWPSTTNGCAEAAKKEYTTNDLDLYNLAFDSAADENAQWTVVMPSDWDAGVITAKFYWETASGSAAQTVKWYIQGKSIANDDAIDGAWGTAVGVSDTWIANGDLHVSDATGDVTIAGAGASELVQFRVYRDISEDDLGGDALLLGVMITYTRS